VYRARDTRLDRDIAIKVLPEHLAGDPVALARFEREAKALAALNHPHIAGIYGVEEAGDTCCLLLELVEGETLADVLGARRLAVGEALGIARQVADALEAAHDAGIVHRDLKPANVGIRPDGTVKVLDFGLATAMPTAVDSSGAQTVAPTVTSGGVVVGTAAYMSPEQARGMAVDRRTDIWAFGCLLYELLSGRRAFDGATVSDTIAAVLQREPNWTALPAGTPRAVVRLLQRCLEKDLKRRLRDAGDVRLEIEDVLAGRTEPATRDAGARRPAAWRRMLPWAVAVAGLVGGALVAWNARTAIHTPPPRAHLLIQLPEDVHVAVGSGQPALALSPDGRLLVFAGERSGRTQLYLRALDDDVVRPIAGTDGGYSPFFSPDGAWIGYFDRGMLKKVSPRGGSPIVLHDTTPVTLGATWGPDNVIVLTPGPETGLARASVADERIRPTSALVTLTRPAADRGEGNHSWPSMLPDGRHVIFAVRTGPRPDDARVAVMALDGGERLAQRSMKVLALSGTNPVYSDGHVLFVRDGRLVEVPFDTSHLVLSGSPTELAAGLMIESTGGAQFSVTAGGGTLAYVEGETARNLVWVDRQGRSQPLLENGTFFGPRLSPDDTRVAYATTEGSNTDVRIFDLTRGTKSRLTSHPGEDFEPVWSPDGRRLAFASEIGEDEGEVGPGLAWKSVDSSDRPERLLKTPIIGEWDFPTSWTPKGAALVFSGKRIATGWDVFLLPLAGERRPRPLVQTAFDEYDAVVSPDGRWIAYVTDETGQDEVCVLPLDATGGRRPVSTNGGTEPCWSRDGRELFYRDGDKVMVVSVDGRTGFPAGVPRMLFSERFLPRDWPGGPRNYDVDGHGRFVMVARKSDIRPQTIHVLLNWADRLHARTR
jgi:Tol biopolymer transport system component